MSELSDEILESLPLFPLPGAVLFPGTLMPLHMFEPRYRKLTEDCLNSHRIMAIGCLQPGHEDDDDERAPVFDMMGAGMIVAHKQLDNGHWNIALHGLSRVRLVNEWPTDEPYRLIRAQQIPDDERADDRLGADRLRNMVVQLLSNLPEALRELNGPLQEMEHPGQIADVVSGLLIEDPKIRQTLVAEPRVAHRLDLLGELVGNILLETYESGDDGLH